MKNVLTALRHAAKLVLDGMLKRLGGLLVGLAFIIIFADVDLASAMEIVLNKLKF